MSTPLSPVITRAGLSAVVAAHGTGLQATIGAIGVGLGRLVGGVRSGYVPTDEQTALVSEAVRVPIMAGSRLDPAGFRVLARIPARAAGAADYPIFEVGFYLTNGTLFAVWSDARVLAVVTEFGDVDIAMDLMLQTLPVQSIALSVTEPDIPDTTGVLAAQVAGLTRLHLAHIALDQRLRAAGLI